MIYEFSLDTISVLASLNHVYSLTMKSLSWETCPMWSPLSRKYCLNWWIRFYFACDFDKLVSLTSLFVQIWGHLWRYRRYFDRL